MFRSSGQNIQLEGVLCLPAAVLLFVYQGEWKEQLSSTGFLRRESAQNTMHLKLSVCVTVCVHRSEEDSEGNRDICSEILQMKALERLTSTVSVCLKITQIQNLLTSQKNLLFWRRLSNRCKVSWRLLLPERLAKLVSMNYELWFCEDVTWWVRGAISGDFMLSGWLQYQSRTLRRQRRATRSLERPARRAAR